MCHNLHRNGFFRLQYCITGVQTMKRYRFTVKTSVKTSLRNEMPTVRMILQHVFTGYLST